MQDANTATIPLAYERLDPETQRARAQAFLQLMQKRRSVRDFSPDPVPMDLIETIIRTAGTAPSGANKQPWRFVVVTDPDLKRRIREAAEKEERENYERRFPQDWLQDLQPLGTNWQKPFLEIAPVLIVMFKIDYGLDEEGRRIKHYYVNESAGIAAGMLIAAIHNAGLVTVTHTPSPMGFLREILQRPINEKPFLLLPVGYPAADARVPDIHKKPLSKIMLVNPGLEA